MAVGCHRLKIRVVIVEQLEVDRLHILPCIKIHGDLLFHEMASLCRKYSEAHFIMKQQLLQYPRQI